MYCPYCGVHNNDEANFCTGCGRVIGAVQQTTAAAKSDTGQQSQSTSSSQKNPLLALILSLIIVGLGQFYIGENKKGALMLGIAVLSGVFSAGILWFAISIWSAYDAYTMAKTK